MSVISRSEINAALRELLGLRGSVALALDETVQPVMLAGDLAGVGPNSFPIPFFDFGDAAGNAAGLAGVILINPADSGVVVTVEQMIGRATSAGARVEAYVGTLNRDFPKPVFDLATGTKTVIEARVARKGLPAVNATPLIIEAGAKTGPGFAGDQWANLKSDDQEVEVLRPPAYWVLPPDSWIGARNHLAGAAAPLRLHFYGRIWPLG